MPELKRIPICRPCIPPSGLIAMQECIESGWIGYGPKCTELERRFAKRGGYGLATANCTAALYLAGRICVTSDKDEVIVPAISFVSTAMAFRCAGMKVKLIDVDLNTGLVDVTALEQIISPKTRAIVVVHIFGQRVQGLNVIREICSRHQLLLIEDCAHRIDLANGKMPLADIACYSFNAVKEVPAGEGGLLWCRDEVLMSRARSISNVGLTTDTPARAHSLIHSDYEFSEEVGLKLRANDLVAALAIAGLETLEANRVLRKNIFSVFSEAIHDSKFLKLLTREDDDSFLMCILKVQAERRQEVRDLFARMLISTSIHYPSLSRHPLFSADSALNAEQFDTEVLTVPCFPSMAAEDVNRVASALSHVGNHLK